MDADGLIQEAIAKYNQLHSDLARARASYPEYQRLYQWLVATRQMFPEAFSELREELPAPSEPLPTLLEMPKTDLREFEPQPPSTFMGAMAGILEVAAGVQDNLTLSARRSLNEKALKLVETILDIHGPQKLDFIIQEMRLAKWDGYPIDEPVNLYNALQTRHRKGERFVNLGDNKWGLIGASGGAS